MKHDIECWFVIINPNAGKGNGQKSWPDISFQLKKKGINFKCKFTRKGGFATNLVIEAINIGYRKFIVAGGDGTLNEVVNGCFNQEIVDTKEIYLAMIPIGTGNDWARNYSIDLDITKAIDSIAEYKTKLQDVGWIRYKKNKKKHTRYFVNTAGMGYDAEVVYKTNKHKINGRNGAFLYFYNLIVCLLGSRFYNVKLKLKDQKISGDMFSICIAICRYSGGGMVQTPNALADDGLFDITIIKRIRKMDVIRSVKLLYNEQILTHKKVVGLRAKKVKITAKPKMKFHVDGESISRGNVVLGIKPRSIHVVTG